MIMKRKFKWFLPCTRPTF